MCNHFFVSFVVSLSLFSSACCENVTFGPVVVFTECVQTCTQYEHEVTDGAFGGDVLRCGSRLRTNVSCYTYCGEFLDNGLDHSGCFLLQEELVACQASSNYTRQCADCQAEHAAVIDCFWSSN